MTWAPPIAAHRLLGDGSTTALLRPAGEVDWWCAPAMDSPPVLWSLLDEQGAAARWTGVRLSASAGRAAGPVLTTVLQSPRGRVECRDALLERRGARTAFVTTEGFAHLLHLRRQTRAHLYRPCAEHPEPLVPLERCVGVRGRIGRDGELEPLDLETLPELDAEAIAVCLLSSGGSTAGG